MFAYCGYGRMVKKYLEVIFSSSLSDGKEDIDLMISTPNSAVQLDFADGLEEIDTLLDV